MTFLFMAEIVPYTQILSNEGATQVGSWLTDMAKALSINDIFTEESTNISYPTDILEIFPELIS